MKELFQSVFIVILFLGTSFPQNWLPLEVGNKWQFVRIKTTGLSLPNLTTTYSLNEIVIENDTIINDVKYYLNGTEYIRYSSTDNKAYIFWNNEDRVYMDFNKTIGDTFHSGTTVYTITEGKEILFSDTLDYKGFKRNYIVQPNWTSVKTEVRFIEGIGRYSFYSSSSSAYQFNSQIDDFLMGVLYDTLGHPIYLTGHYKPEIALIPITIINKKLFRMELNVNHFYNIYPSQNSSGFNFLDSIILESHYTRLDSVIVNPIGLAGIISGSKYAVGKLLDTTLMQNGFSFNYRIIVKDKGIIPETSFSPDTGYYKCVWDFSTDIIDTEPLIKEFNLEQNYPNPFNPSTKISWQSPVGSHQTLKVYDVLGREVSTLVNEYRDAGSYEVEFDGSQLASGVYYYQLKVGEFVKVKKMMQLK